jgi:hypothetical protein
MNRSVKTSLERLDLYLERIRYSLKEGDREQALSDAAELTEVARRLWTFLADQAGYSCIEAQIRLAAGGEN